MQVKFSKTFKKAYGKLDPKIRSAVDKRITLFIKDSTHPQLRNHSLKGELSGLRSIDITGDFRAVYRSLEAENSVCFELLGTHSELYR